MRPWQSLSQRYGIPWRSTAAENDKMPMFRSIPQGHHHGASPEAPFHAGVSPHFPCFSIFHTIKDRISPRSHTRLKDEFHRAAPPRLVPGCRFVPFKIAASLSLLAMTNLVGFAEKRNSFWNEKGFKEPLIQLQERSARDFVPN